MDLKSYQRAAIDRVEAYLMAVRRIGKAADPFKELTGQEYVQPPGIQGSPAVCVKIPTAGGKTIVAAHAAGLAGGALLERSNPLILWLAPSEPIASQTIRALRDNRHPYHTAVAKHIPVANVFSLDEAQWKKSGDYEAGATIIVSTVQAMRVSEGNTRLFYRQNGDLMGHFSPDDARHPLGWLDESGNLLPEGQQPVPSLANMIRKRTPIVIVDESHNFVSILSRTLMSRLAPACILEITATPDESANILYDAPILEVKDAGMLKLPLHLETGNEWRDMLSRAIAMREVLESNAVDERSKTHEYIRPVLLIQAQSDTGADSITPDKVVAVLTAKREDGGFAIPRDQIAIATGEKDELPDDIQAESCQIRHVVTIAKLREGWDCPFAYVLCSLAQTESDRAIKQMVGRVLRLPQATVKQNIGLNHAYAFTVSENYQQSTEEFRKALIGNGFKKAEARQFVTSRAQFFLPSRTLVIPANEVDQRALLDLGRLNQEVADKVRVEEVPAPPPEPGETASSQPTIAIHLHGTLSPEATRLVSTTVQRQLVRTKVIEFLQDTTAAQDGPTRYGRIQLPLLEAVFEQFTIPFTSEFASQQPWDLADCPATLGEDIFPAASPIQAWEYDYTKSGLQFHQEQDFLTIALQNSFLKNWSDRLTLEQTVAQFVSMDCPSHTFEAIALFVDRVIDHLKTTRNLDLAKLRLETRRLTAAILKLIQRHADQAKKRTFQEMLFDQPKTVRASASAIFDLATSDYSPTYYYSGAYQFSRHYFTGRIGMLKDGTEEYECARHLDTHPQVKCWLRNLAKHGFGLPWHEGTFYPDFIAIRTDGVLVVVEHKGKHLRSGPEGQNKAEIVNRVGLTWAKLTESTPTPCRFVMTEGKNWQVIDQVLSP